LRACLKGLGATKGASTQRVSRFRCRWRSDNYGLGVSSPMGWEIAAIWMDDADPAWYWTWRRVEDDSGRVVEESLAFSRFEHCIDDAQAHGLERADCVVGAHDC
jgi:hypothetical protein